MLTEHQKRQQELTTIMEKEIQLRDHFAGLAMQGWLASIPYDGSAGPVSVHSIAALAYQMADAMMEEREE